MEIYCVNAYMKKITMTRLRRIKINVKQISPKGKAIVL